VIGFLLPFPTCPLVGRSDKALAVKEMKMYRAADVPEACRPFFFVNAGGPSRRVVSREVVGKKWQLVVLDCGHQILMPKYQKSAKVGCGFCGGLEPLSES
jgi:hypothetical protein